MTAKGMERLGRIEDPRQRRGRRHLLADVLVIALSALICGADGWKAVATFGRAKRKWFKSFLSLPHGIPSHSTFERIFAALRPEALERCLGEKVEALRRKQERQVAVDGKSLRGSFDRASNQAAIHMVSAWASANEMVLGQLATEVKSNEITAIPKLLSLLDIAGATVTIDAMGCQKDIASQIVEQGGDYVLAVKDNQPTLHAEVRLFMDTAIATSRRDVPLSFHQEVDGDHGRIEIRRVWVTSAVDWYEDRGQWKGLRSFAAVECEREAYGRTTLERQRVFTN